jgi:hypothetical protein
MHPPVFFELVPPSVLSCQQIGKDAMETNLDNLPLMWLGESRPNGSAIERGRQLEGASVLKNSEDSKIRPSGSVPLHPDVAVTKNAFEILVSTMTGLYEQAGGLGRRSWFGLGWSVQLL